MTLIKGQKYSKEDVGFTRPQFRDSSATIKGERYFFITINGEFDNELDNGDLIVDTRFPSQVVQQNSTLNEPTHVFVREDSGSTSYDYIGDLDHIAPHNDKKRNRWVLK